MKVPKATHILGNEPRLFMCSLKWVPKGLYLRWLEEPSGTPQVLSSTPRGSEFQAEVKKIPSLALCAKALVVSRPQVGLRTLTVCLVAG